MTIIALIISNDQPAVLVSDTALSGGGPVLNSDFFPVQQKSPGGFFSPPQVMNECLTGMSQKIWLSGRHALLWSGSYLAAYGLVGHLRDNIHALNPDSFLKLAEECLGRDLEKLALIYICDYGREVTRFVQFGCDIRKYGEITVICAGTGSYRFLTEFDAEKGSATTATTFQVAWSRVAHLLETEVVDSNNYFHGIGIGYEFAVLGDGGWEKVPYAAMVVGHSEDSFSFKKVISTFYKSEQLFFLTSICENQPNWAMENWVYLPNEQKISASNVVHVPSFPPRQAINPVDLWDSLDVNDAESQVIPVFTICLVERRGRNIQTGEVVFDIASISRMPATVGVVRLDGLNVLASRAFFRREIEEIYLGRDFTPPAHKVAFYDQQKADQIAGIPLAFGAAKELIERKSSGAQ